MLLFKLKTNKKQKMKYRFYFIFLKVNVSKRVHPFFSFRSRFLFYIIVITFSSFTPLHLLPQ